VLAYFSPPAPALIEFFQQPNSNAFDLFVKGKHFQFGGFRPHFPIRDGFLLVKRACWSRDCRPFGRAKSVRRESIGV
jgi:hypothetical protein